MAKYNANSKTSFQEMLNNTPELTEERRLKTQRGCRKILIGVGLLVAGLVLFFGCPELIYPNKIKGKVLDVIYVPAKNFKDGKLWILTDGFYVYTSKELSGNSSSKGNFFSKKFIHIYDPVNKKIINRFNIKYKGLGSLIKLVYQKNSVLMIIPQDAENKQYPEIIRYNAENGKIIATTEDFMKRFPEISSGIAEFYYSHEPESLILTSHDGQKCTYYFDCDTVFVKNEDYQKYKSKGDDTTNITLYILAEDYSAPQRRELYQIVGPKLKLANGHISESIIKDSSSLYFFYKAKSKPLLPKKVFLEGYILYSDTNYIVILHQKQIGNASDRILSCINMEGKYLWTMEQSNLFPNLCLSSNDAFSSLFFIKSELFADRFGNLLIFKFKNNEIMGIDIVTGKKLWTYIK